MIFSGVGLLSVLFYYATVLVLCTEGVSNSFQPEAALLFMNVLSNWKALVGILLLPLVALVPDYLMRTSLSLFRPTCVEKLMRYIKYAY